MSTLSDSDDSDDDFLLQQRIFAKPKSKKKKHKLTPIETLKRIVSGKPKTTCNDGMEKSAGQKRMLGRQKHPSNKKQAKSKKAKPDDNRKHEKSKARRQDDPMWIETQARKTVEEELSLDVVSEVTNLNDIGWYAEAAKQGKRTKYYPVIFSQNKAEARLLLKNKTNRSYETKKIQYLGVGWRYALAHGEIALSKWIPYSKSSDSENEERLQNFVKHISKTSLLKNDPVGLKIEELAVRKMWEKVRTQQEHRQLEEEKEDAEALGSASNIDPSSAAVPLVSVTQDSDSNSQNSKAEEVVDTDSDNDDGYDDASVLSPGRNRTKRIPLQLKDEIEFYESIGTFGNPSSLRRATIVGVRPNNPFPLLLSNTILIPVTHRVRRSHDGFWQPISDFVLVQEGIQSLADKGSALDEATKRMREINAEIAQAKDDFWKNEYDKAEAQDNGIEKEEKTKDNTSVVNDDDVDASSNTDVVPPDPIRRSPRSTVRVRSKAN